MQQRSSEVTVRAVVLGLLLSIVMGAANVYFGLRAGMTVSASIPAAVIALALLRLFPRKGTVLECNLVQTTASAGESLAAGVIFTMPALVIAGLWTDFASAESFWVVTIVAGAGGLLGILFMIPMRRVFVVDHQELIYPEGRACAEVLHAGERAGRGVQWLVLGMTVGALVRVAVGYLKVAASSVERAFFSGQRVALVGADVSPGLVAVGFICGLWISFQIFLGGAIGWLVALPSLGGFEGNDVAGAAEHAWTLWSSEVRYIGVGAMVVGGLVTIVKVRGGLVAAVRELVRQSRGKESGEVPSTERNIGGVAVLFFSVLTIALIAGLYYHLTGGVGITSVTTFAMVVLAFFFTAVASYIVGLVGNSNSPVSGMTITAVLATGALIWLCGFEGSEAMLATLGVAGVVCATACTAGDVCNDLKTGHLVGASPRSQQILQILGVTVAAFVMCPVLHVLHESSIQEGGTGIGGSEYPAPQASLFASLVKGIFSKDGEGLDANLLGWGAGIGVAIVLVDAGFGLVFGKNRPYRLHLMPIAVGIYLPFSVSVPIFFGGLIAWVATRRLPRERRESATQGGVLLASGLIAGESLTGVFIAALFYLGADAPSFDVSAAGQQLRGLSVLLVIGLLIALVTRGSAREVR